LTPQYTDDIPLRLTASRGFRHELHRARPNQDTRSGTGAGNPGRDLCRAVPPISRVEQLRWRGSRRPDLHAVAGSVRRGSRFSGAAMRIPVARKQQPGADHLRGAACDPRHSCALWLRAVMCCPVARWSVALGCRARKCAATPARHDGHRSRIISISKAR